MYLGAHVSVAGGLERAIDRQRSIGGTCGQIFSASPRIWARPDIADATRSAFRAKTLAHLDGPWVLHAIYLINLASPKDDLRERSIDRLQVDIDLAEHLGVEYVNTHLGAHTGAGIEAGLETAIESLDALSIPEDVTLLLETDAGAGTKLGGTFEELETVRAGTRHDCGICFDTAHVHVSASPMDSPEAVEGTLETFDSVIGLEYLQCIHLNDSKHPSGSNKDEHAHIGEGTVGAEAIGHLVRDKRLEGMPFVLETPTEDGRSFPWNIERVKALRAQ